MTSFLTRSASTDFFGTAATPNLTVDLQTEIEAQIIQAVNAELGNQLSSAGPDHALSPELRRRSEDSARRITRAITMQRRVNLSALQEDNLIQTVLNKLVGYGFLEMLLPPNCDVSEIMLNPDGSVWVIPRGQSVSERVSELTPSLADAQMVVGKILARVNRRATEAEPIVSAKLPRSKRLPAGARVNVVMPPVANGLYPALNLRLYEHTPVRPEKLIEWGVLSRELFDFLVAGIRAHRRIMIAGGTGSGKTTLLSALANFIPPTERILLIEDPAEIFVDHPHVVSLEARPPSLEGKYGVTVGDGVTTAMRMTPKWLIVGEVRHGGAALWLLRAQMSDHPGLSTIHAYSPSAAIDTLCMLAGLDLNIPRRDMKELIAHAIDWFVQVEYVQGVRRVTRVCELAAELKGGDVRLDELWRYEQTETDDPATMGRWVQVKSSERMGRG